MQTTYNLAPGNILQNMMLRTRIKDLKTNGFNTFIELGSGNGNISKLLLDLGLSGVGYDLSSEACEINSELNNKYINDSKYIIKNDDFFKADNSLKVDLIISSHVIEHLSDNLLEDFFVKSTQMLKRGGDYSESCTV